MTIKDIPSNWPEHLDAAIKHLNDRILQSLKYSSNELLLGLVVNTCRTDSPEEIEPPTVEEVNIHLVFVKQQHLNGYAATVDHTIKQKATFNAKVRQQPLKNVIFQPGDLVQAYVTKLVRRFTSVKKLIPMWSIPHRIVTRKLNSYTLETLGRLLLAGDYNSRQLWIFEPREGTKLAVEELSHMETCEGDEME